MAEEPVRIVEVFHSADGWRWRLKARNGRIVADSGEAYGQRSDATEAAEREFPEAQLRFVEG